MKKVLIVSVMAIACSFSSTLVADTTDLLLKTLQSMGQLVEQNKNIIKRLESVEAKRENVAEPLNCNPKGTFLFDLGASNWNNDIFQCGFHSPAKGFFYLSLQGHQRSRDGAACSFGIYVDGRSINTASRNYPSHTYFTNWHPSFMADTISVSKGNHTISLRAQGSACSIHDPDINGFFISSGL